MKSASRRQVKTPVGNKTKRGAELEGTPKTPKAFEASPGKSPCIDGSSQEPDDRRLPLRTRRPLQWNNISKQGVMGDDDTRGENTLSPHQQQIKLKCTGESKEVSALSPICLNAIHANSGQQGGGRKIGSKKPYELPSSVMSPSIKNCDGITERKRHGKAKALDWNARQDRDDAGSTDEGSCPSSPDLPSSGKQMLFWSNAAFNTQPVHNETVSISKDTASSSSCSSSASSSSRQNAASNERADSEAESKSSEEHEFSVEDEKNSRENCPIDGRQKGAMLDGACATMDPMKGPSNPKLKPVENLKVEHGHGCQSDVWDVASMARKKLFESGKSSPTEEGDYADTGSGHIEFPPFSSLATKQKGYLQAGDAAENEEEEIKGGLDEIQQEIERLTERLAELHLQKRKREEEMQRQKQAKIEKTTDSRLEEEENAAKHIQDKRAGAGAGGRVKGVNCAASSGRSAFFRQSPKAQMQKNNGVALKSRGESPLAPVGRRAQGSAASVSKLSEMRRSVSSTGRRMERSSSDERTKALRRLSLSGAATTTSESKSQQQQAEIKSVPTKGTPSRVVSSRYGRAITPDACRPASASGSSHQTSSKKRDRPSATAVSSPMPAQPQPSPSPSASVACSPLKKAATFRSGYPSRSGFSTTPTKDREVVIKPAALVSSSLQLPLSTLSSALTQSQDRTRLLLSPPRCMSPLPRFDSPKSTAALYKCLESLLEDSKHFFKRLSPARPNRLPQLQETAIAGAAGSSASASTATTSVSACDCSPKQLLAAMEHALPTINTCRLDAFSPRDSGCVKRASDRQKKRFYFAQEECMPQALESS